MTRSKPLGPCYLSGKKHHRVNATDTRRRMTSRERQKVEGTEILLSHSSRAVRGAACGARSVIWHCLRGCLSQNARSRNELRRIKNRVGTLDVFGLKTAFSWVQNDPRTHRL